MSADAIHLLVALSSISSPMALSLGTTSPARTAVGIPSQRTSTRRMANLLTETTALQPIGTYVGELQEKWQFPSDHIPIGMTFEGLNFVSWNVLDAKNMAWLIEKNTLGLSRSMIADEHVYIGDSKLTIRDRHVADLILETLSHPTHPRSILSLQECSAPFIEELRARIPAHFEILSVEGESLLIDRNLFEVVSAKGISGIFSDDRERTVQDVTIRRLDNGQHLRLVNVHLPGDPTKPGRFEFAEYLEKTFDPDVTTIALGDMNFNELEISDAMCEAFPNGSPFSRYSPYPTNISLTLHSKAIDHFLVYSKESSSVTLSAPDEIMAKLSEVLALLQ